MYTYIYIHTHTHTHTHVHMYIYICNIICIHTGGYVCVQCVLLLQNVFFYYRMCSLTIERERERDRERERERERPVL